MSTPSKAYILNFSGGFRAAISNHEMQQLLIDPQLSAMPVCPIFCRQVFSWKNQLLPCMDISSILANSHSDETPAKLLAVACFTSPNSKQVTFGGLLIANKPQLVSVDDTQATDLPKHPYIWKAFTHSCFTFEGDKIPIINLPKLFSYQFQQLTQAFLKHRTNRHIVQPHTELT